MSKNYCKNCGIINDNDSKFCVRCGTNIDTVHPKKAVFNDYSSKDLNNAVEDYSRYVQIIAVLEIAFGVLAFIGSTIMWFLAFNLPKIIPHIENVDPEFAHFWPLVNNLLFLIAFALTTYGILSIIFGIGLYRFKSYGRIGTMVNGALGIFNVPIGTVFGIATLYVLTRPEMNVLFAKNKVVY